MVYTEQDLEDEDLDARQELRALMPSVGQGVSENLSADLAAARLRKSLCGDSFKMILGGRFELLKEIGTGGMGVVYRAYDPQLERDVAIKLLQSRAARSRSVDPRRSADVMREARMLARLVDPYVVRVFEVGTHEGEVYIVMEFVDGMDLGTWVQTNQPSWREILDAYIQAGKGLAAAHEANIIHRDFKPSNTRRDDKGHVRVIDFGLAALGDSRFSTIPKELGASRSYLARRHPSEIAGTPRYMAPEQLAGLEVSGASDQYSFCTSLYEALTGRHPDPRHSTQVHESRRAEGVPGWVLQVLERGLEADPARRYQSMRPLLAELEPNRERTWRGRVLLIVLTATASSGVGLWLSQEPDPAARCMAQAAAPWTVTASARVRVRDAFARANANYAAATLARVDASLDSYIERWSESFRDACRAHFGDRVQSQGLFDRRMLCLQHRRGEVMILLDRLTGVDNDERVARSAATAVAALPSVARCDDVRRLAEIPAPPPHQAPAIEQNSYELDAFEVDFSLFGARPDEATLESLMQRVELLLADTESLGYAPATARAYLAHGRLLFEMGRNDEALMQLHQAETYAEKSSDDASAIAALHEAARVELLNRISAKGGRMLLERASAKLERLGESGRLRAANHDLEGHLAYIEHRFEDAIAAHGAALAAYELLAREDTRLDRQRANINLGRAHSEAGHSDQALSAYQRSYELAEELYGEGHPALTGTRYNHAVEFMERGALDEALVLIEWVRTEDARAHGERSLAVADDERVIAAVLQQQGKVNESLTYARSSAEIFMHHPDATAVQRASAMDAVGVLQTAVRDHVSAATSLERAQELWRSTSPREPMRQSITERHVGELELARGRSERALENFTRAVTLLRDAGVEAGDSRYANVEYGRARALMDQGDVRSAAAALEIALTTWGERCDNPTGHAEAKVLMAEALIALGRDRRRACELIDAARAYYARRDVNGTSPPRELAALSSASCQAH